MTFAKAYTRQREEFVADAVAAIQPYVNAAAGSAASAASSAATVEQEVGIWPSNPSGLTEGAYWAAARIPAALRFHTFDAQVLTGTGTIGELTILVDDYAVYGPVAVDTTGSTTTVDILVGAGSTIKFQIGNVTGTVTAALARLRGGLEA